LIQDVCLVAFGKGLSWRQFGESNETNFPLFSHLLPPPPHTTDYIEVVKLLIKAGADVNLKETNLGLCPLRIALDAEKHEIAVLLIAAGAVNPPPEPNRPEEEEAEGEGEGEAAEEAALAPAPAPAPVPVHARSNIAVSPAPRSDDAPAKSQEPWDPSVVVSACCIVS